MSVSTLESKDTRQGWTPHARTGDDLEFIATPEEDERGYLLAETVTQFAEYCRLHALAYQSAESLVKALSGDWVRANLSGSTGPTWSRVVADFDATPFQQAILAGLHVWRASLPRVIAVPELDAAVVAEDPPRPAREIDPQRAAEDLREWLDLTYDDLAAITGIAKNTVHYWKRTGASARPSTVRKLWRVHTLVHALISQLGQTQAVEWLRAGPESPLNLLLAGDLEAVERKASRLLFRPPENPSDQADYVPFRPEQDFDEHVEQPATDQLRRARRRPTRGRLSDS